MSEDLNVVPIGTILDIDYPILVRKFGEKKAIEIIMLSRELNRAARIRTGAEPEPHNLLDC